MKKILTTCFLAITICFSVQSAVFAQNDIKIGAGVVYSSDIESAGIQLNATFRISPKIGIAPDISFYFPDEDDEFGPVDSFWAVNLNGHYIFAADPGYHFYGLGGLNVTSYGFDDPPGEPDFDDSESELGINLGLGGEYHLDDFSLYSELKYIISDLDRVVLAVGVRLPID